MNQKFTCGIWCWVAYALPCLGLFAWCATGHPADQRWCLLLWFYGFPSTALLLPVITLFWVPPPSAEFLVTALLTAVVNGALLLFMLRQVRHALQGDGYQVQ